MSIMKLSFYSSIALAAIAADTAYSTFSPANDRVESEELAQNDILSPFELVQAGSQVESSADVLIDAEASSEAWSDIDSDIEEPLGLAEVGFFWRRRPAPPVKINVAALH